MDFLVIYMPKQKYRGGLYSAVIPVRAETKTGAYRMAREVFGDTGKDYCAPTAVEIEFGKQYNI